MSSEDFSNSRHRGAAGAPSVPAAGASAKSSGESQSRRLLARAKELAGNKSWVEASTALHEAIQTANSFRELSLADTLLTRVRRATELHSKRRGKIAVVGSTTLDFLVPALRAACFGAGIDAEMFQGAFNQYRQEMLDPHSPLAAFRPDVVIVATDWRSLALPDEADDPKALVAAKIAELRGLWRICKEHTGGFVIQHNFEIPPADPYGCLSAALAGGRARVLQEINLGLWDAAREEGGVSVLDVEQVAARYGKSRWDDPVLWYSAKQYPAVDALPILVRLQVAVLRAALGLMSKCLVVDLDGLLWGGVIGEDGVGGIVLGGAGVGEAFTEFQRYLKSLKKRGVLLAVCSKNNEEDAKAPFTQHQEMSLRLEDFALFVANWRAKDENLRTIAATLNIGLDSLVFLDDNPLERAWVRRQLPEVEVPELPGDPALYVPALAAQMYFEAVSLTEDDRRRAECYRQNAQRKTLGASAANVEDFLASLNMEVELGPVDERNVARVAQLINKTNQFNLTTRRISEAQVRSLVDHPGCYTQCMRLRDQFGDSGLVGVLIAFHEGETLRIDNWLVSCRVLGRRVEEVMIGALLRYARACGFQYVAGEYIPTAKNGQVSDLFDRLGFTRISDAADGTRKYQRSLAAVEFEIPKFFRVDDRTPQSSHAARLAGGRREGE